MNSSPSMDFFKSVFSPSMDFLSVFSPSMDFFKSVFTDKSLEPSDSDEPQNGDAPSYRKDLKEFGSGLRMETAVIRDASSCAVKDLPASLEIGATVTQESLESVGQAIDGIGSSVWKPTADIISQGKHSLLAVADEDSDAFGQLRQLVPNNVDYEKKVQIW